MSAKKSNKRKNTTAFYETLRFIVKGLIKLVFRVKYEGRENIPTDCGYILCSNHRSLIDPIFIALPVPVQLRFMGKAELFRSKFMNWLLRKLGAFPIERGARDTSALDYAAQILRDGGMMAMFPEGTRSKTGELLPFRSGVSVVAAQTNANILPVSVSFKGKLHLWSKVTVRFGELIPFESLDIANGSELKLLRGTTKKLRAAVEALLDPQEVSAQEKESV